MGSKKNVEPGTMVLKGIVHDCKDGKHKALLIGQDGAIYETMPASSEDVEAFVDEKAEKYGVPHFMGEECRSDPALRKMMGKESRKSADIVRGLTKPR